VTAHSEPLAQVVLQSPLHLIVQLEVELHVTVLPPPTSSLHIELPLQVAVDEASSLKSQFEVSLHVTVLWSPPSPLHCDESLHATVSAPLVSPSHFDALVHASEQSLSPHAVLQSVPAVHEQLESAQTQPVPAQLAPVSLPPHAAIAIVVKPNATSHAIRMARS
jgi:hypothetical protein